MKPISQSNFTLHARTAFFLAFVLIKKHFCGFSSFFSLSGLEIFFVTMAPAQWYYFSYGFWQSTSFQKDPLLFHRNLFLIRITSNLLGKLH